MVEPYGNKAILNIQLTLAHFEGLSNEPRTTVCLEPRLEAGRLLLAGLPQAWIAAERKFLRSLGIDAPIIVQEGTCSVHSPRLASDKPGASEVESCRW